MEKDQTSQLCPICFLSNTKTSFIRLSCGCSACSYCISSWILNKITAFHYTLGDHIPCITSGCVYLFNIDEVRPYLPRNMLNRIDNSLFQAYLNKTVDIRRCPGHGCSYAGIVAHNSTCKQNLECSLCKTQWSDQQPSESKKREAFTALWKWVHTKKCPRCQISIQKNGGCPHMVCSKCLCQFCWYCMLDNDSHSALKHLYREVIIPLIFIIPFLIGIAYLLVCFYNIPAVNAFAEAIISPPLLALVHVVTWIFLTFWKLGVALLFDFSLRVLLFARPLVFERKIACLMAMAFSAAVTCYYGAYQGVMYAMVVETAVVSLFKWLIYVKEKRLWGKETFQKVIY